MKIVAYYRVSTQRQGRSGLGLDAQREAVHTYSRSKDATIVASFTEVETGKRSDRPQLAAAIRSARRNRARLVIAKLDRLARNVHFVSSLMESKVDFVCCDNENATPLTIHILAAVAEDEAKRISERTKAALAAAKRRGTQLGTHRPGHQINWQKGSRNGLKKAQQAHVENAAERREIVYGPILDTLREWRDNGVSYRAIADRLNDAGEPTLKKDGVWHAMTVQRLLG